MTQGTAMENRLPAGEAEGRSPSDQASVEAHGEQTNGMRLDQKDGLSATHPTRRGLLGRLSAAVGGLVLAGVGHAGILALPLEFMSEDMAILWYGDVKWQIMARLPPSRRHAIPAGDPVWCIREPPPRM
jgi:hypothetical protein